MGRAGRLLNFGWYRSRSSVDRAVTLLGHGKGYRIIAIFHMVSPILIKRGHIKNMNCFKGYNLEDFDCI